MLGLHVVFAIDRAGLVGEDGETHHGVFDVGFLRQIPGMTVLCPGSMAELRDMLSWAVNEQSGPVAIRYPRGTDRGYSLSAWNGNHTLSVHQKGNDVVLVTYGAVTQNVMQAADLLQQRGISAKVLRLLTLSPLPISDIVREIGDCKTVVIVEEVCNGSGICQELSFHLHQDIPGVRVLGLDLGHNFVPHGALDRLYRHCGIDADAIANKTLEVLKVEN